MFTDRLLGETRPVLVDRLDTADTFSRWVRLVPQLADDGRLTNVAGVVGVLTPRRGQRLDPIRCDTLLGALARVAAEDGGDDPDAVLLVLHVLAPGALRLVQRGLDEGLVLGQLAIQVRTYPWRTRTRAVAANLLLDTEHALCRELHPARMQTRRRRQPTREILVDWSTAAPSTVAATIEPEDGLDLFDVLWWAERTGVVDGRDLSMLVEYYYGRELTGAGHEHVARTFGVTTRTSKRRCATALRALRAAAPQYLAS